ncbi:ABC transporter ATP-binding protein [Desulfofustis glycolicus]|uniref:NitT/TauT family transport system ATP-binding protein n=1 Tax=Desulfofustis glycolicus DSM 9705 TaxID=1121409 RepID=A0A1M5XZR2_9BACT|nr:ABC transporter ATP-binding protein [Desulfofustis glycolicus]MCB2218241.1 ABC transporter ATP-binding protein [Desulfobulbaceae bacterium]SHI05305.1 NitT/TauT family transport system ATP-binding protein [Desulfofustis glycolicus DSM 9705]
MITVHSVNLSFAHNGATLPVLRDISFHLESEDYCAIIGPSGCGKTSLLFLLAGLLQPDSGTIDITGSPRSGTILQNFGLFPWKTVSQNIALGLVLQKRPPHEVRRRVDSLLEEMGLSGFGEHFPGQLSGGMQQRVALARALAIEPDILFMDEPLSSLDALTRERLQNLIVDIRQAKGISTVLVTHSIEEAVFLGRTIIVLSGRPGRVLQIIDNPDADTDNFRQSDTFFQRCIAVRQILAGEVDGPHA